MTAPLVVLNLGEPPYSGNLTLRAHWRARRETAKEFRLRLFLATTQVRGAQAVALAAAAIRPGDTTSRRRVVARWTAPQPPDDDNARLALKPVVDALKGWQDRRVGARTVRVCTGLPLIVDDDPTHLVLEYAPERGSPRRLVLEVYEV